MTLPIQLCNSSIDIDNTKDSNTTQSAQADTYFSQPKRDLDKETTTDLLIGDKNFNHMHDDRSNLSVYMHDGSPGEMFKILAALNTTKELARYRRILLYIDNSTINNLASFNIVLSKTLDILRPLKDSCMIVWLLSSMNGPPDSETMKNNSTFNTHIKSEGIGIFTTISPPDDYCTRGGGYWDATTSEHYRRKSVEYLN